MINQFVFQALLEDKLVFLCFFIGAMICLLCSTLFHTMSCHSEFVSNVFSRLDYAGISILICGSSITWLYFGFYCEFYHRLTYMTTIAILGLLTIVLTLMDKFNRPVSKYICQQNKISSRREVTSPYLPSNSMFFRNTDHLEHQRLSHQDSFLRLQLFI